VLPDRSVTSTVRVRVDEVAVPRARSSGFDVDEAGRALVFRGNRFRPRAGQTVRAAYFVWR
jgi:hypothetical protein